MHLSRLAPNPPQEARTNTYPQQQAGDLRQGQERTDKVHKTICQVVVIARRGKVPPCPPFKASPSPLLPPPLALRPSPLPAPDLQRLVDTPPLPQAPPHTHSSLLPLPFPPWPCGPPPLPHPVLVPMPTCGF